MSELALIEKECTQFCRSIGERDILLSAGDYPASISRFRDLKSNELSLVAYDATCRSKRGVNFDRDRYDGICTPGGKDTGRAHTRTCQAQSSHQASALWLEVRQFLALTSNQENRKLPESKTCYSTW